MINKDLLWIDKEARRLGYETCIVNGGESFWCRKDNLNSTWFVKLENNKFNVEIDRFTSSNLKAIFNWNYECVNFYKIVDLISKYVESDKNE